MQASIKSRLARLEAMHRPTADTWTIGVDVVEWRASDAGFGGAYGGFGRVLASIPPRLIEPGEEFDYVKSMEELVQAMGGGAPGDMDTD